MDWLTNLLIIELLICTAQALIPPANAAPLRVLPVQTVSSRCSIACGASGPVEVPVYSMFGTHPF